MTEREKTLAEAQPAPECALVIFGAQGDLTRRKLMPALCNLADNGLLPESFAVIGVARGELSNEDFRGLMAEDHEGRPGESKAWGRFVKNLHYSRGDFEDPATYQRVKEKLTQLGAPKSVVFYLATPPDYFAVIVEQLGAAGLTTQGDGFFRRVIIEKPFGRDLASAQQLNRRLRAVLHEDQIYRIDHYLGKETVQNLLVFRFANGIFEPIWNRQYIDHVQILVGETLGVEGRGGYYDTAGVLRDMMQNHMFQLMTLVAMEPPSTLVGEGIRNEKLKVLEAIRPMGPEDLASAVRGQYAAGKVHGEEVPGYRSEPKVNPDSKTETFAALKLNLDNWRWAGVPFYLRSGKRLASRDTEISIQFRKPPLHLFRDTEVDQIGPNRLTIRIQPDEGITLRIKAKQPGPTIQVSSVNLDFSYKDFGELPQTTGYERLIHDCMLGDATLFHRADMVEEAWKVATPVLDYWASLPPSTMPLYAPQSWGPEAANPLIEGDGRKWTVPTTS